MSDEKDGAAVRFPPPFAYLSGIAIGALLQSFVTPLSMAIGRELRIAGAGIVAALGVGIMAAAAGPFKKTEQDPKPWKPTPAIISTGIYGYSRNPMYVSMALLQACVGIALLNGWILVLIPPVLWLVYYTAIRHEEVYLERKFGETYLSYKRSVRRWL
ncbi:MAG: isoprenylcysteine carboxylmethyltransferase family protein [Acidobacteriota bacterium]|nr:isoprenylcysteine carboxylmethyltransferase family protein [Acidobacteriota bacterium]MDH3783973.1 isoprenylcysteine carboxylmethyltransferase family protein [Acidobacteriota bacterium]